MFIAGGYVAYRGSDRGAWLQRGGKPQKGQTIEASHSRLAVIYSSQRSVLRLNALFYGD